MVFRFDLGGTGSNRFTEFHNPERTVINKPFLQDPIWAKTLPSDGAWILEHNGYQVDNFPKGFLELQRTNTVTLFRRFCSDEWWNYLSFPTCFLWDQKRSFPIKGISALNSVNYITYSRWLTQWRNLCPITKRHNLANMDRKSRDGHGDIYQPKTLV